ncbi:MAG: hypothetical protein JKY81_02735 [Colwellia sp.]|nr:hypothetical protein [Colwellia sp.]
MKTISMLLLFIISGCSISPVINIPLDRNKGIIYGYGDASCRNVELSCSVNNNRGNPNLYREYTEWKDENGNTMCSCK